MRTRWVEDVLEIWFPLSLAVASYRCPQINSMASSALPPTQGMPSGDLTWVIDVGLVFDALNERAREVLLCMYGLDMGVRQTARRVQAHPQQVMRWQEEGLTGMDRGMRDRGVRLTPQMRLKYA